MTAPNHTATGQLARAIYGLIIVTTVLVALDNFTDSPRVLAVEVIGASATVYLAHVYAEMISETATALEPPGRLLVRALKKESPVFVVVVVPAILVAVAGTGLWSIETAVTLGVAYNFLALFAVGYLGGRRHDHTATASVAWGAAAAALGAVIVAIEAGAGH